MVPKEVEKHLYKIEPNIFMTQKLASFLKSRKLDPKKVYKDKLKPYMTALSNSKYVFQAQEDGGATVVMAISSDSIAMNEYGRTVQETKDYETWLKRVEMTIRDATSYIV